MAIIRTIFPGAPAFLILLLFAAFAPASGDFVGRVDIGGGHKMYLDAEALVFNCCVRSRPQGFREDWNITRRSQPAVFAEVAKFTRVCVYDRPGTPVGEKPSRSDPVRNQPRPETRSPICMPC